MKVKDNKGIGLTDAIIAVIILMIFAGVIISISYNIYLQSTFIKRNEQATIYISQIFEHSQSILYEDLTQKELKDYINEMDSDKVQVIEDAEANRSTPYSALLTVSEANGYEGYITQIDISIIYKLGRKTKKLDMSTLIHK